MDSILNVYYKIFKLWIKKKFYLFIINKKKFLYWIIGILMDSYDELGNRY